MQNFELTTKLILGSAEDALRQLRIDRLLLVCDPFFAKNGWAGRLSLGKETKIFDRVAPDPSLALAAEGAQLLQAFHPTAIAALGGGSTIDCAKAMAYISEEKPLFIAIPTTSGSGSEVTNFAILTHADVKHPLVDPALQPQVAILDEALLEDLPKTLIADGGFDLLSHALEAIAATNAGAFSDLFAQEAFCTALPLLPGSYAGDKAARKPIHIAATMAGIAFSQAGLGVGHALSHALGGEFHVAHGRLNAILMPAVIEYNAPAVMDKYAALARAAGLSTGTDAVALRSLKNALIRLRSRLQLPGTLAQAGISPRQLQEKLPQICQAALADPCCATNPVPVIGPGAEKLLREVMGHG